MEETDKEKVKALKELEPLEAYYRELPPNKKVFLETFSEVGVVVEAAKVAEVSDRAVRFWREKDKLFAELYDLANESFIQKAELELYRRALGKKEAKMSDVLLMFLLKAKRPEIYREKPTAIPITGEIIVRHSIPRPPSVVVESIPVKQLAKGSQEEGSQDATK